MTDEVSLFTRKKRKRKSIDARALNGLRAAIDAARQDLREDRRLTDMVELQGLNYSEIGRILGISRQRATMKAKRAILRKIMLEEVDKGTSLERMFEDLHKLYPRKGRHAAAAEGRGVRTEPAQSDPGDSRQDADG